MPAILRLACLTLCALLAGPLCAIRVSLKAEEKPFEATPLKLDGNSLTYKRAGKEITGSIDEFVPESAFELKKALTAREARPLIELARFALHRDLFAQARDCAKDAVSLDKALTGDGAQINALADTLESESLFSQANAAIDSADAEGARKFLNALISRFKGSSAAKRGEAMLATLDQLAAEVRAKQLEEEARKAQEQADAEIRKKRQPVDDWLNGLNSQLASDEVRLKAADKDASAGQTSKGLSAMEEIINATIKLRESLVKNAGYCIYDGQAATAKDIDARAKSLVIDSYYCWSNQLFAIKNFAQACKLCERGLELAPKDRRLLALKVDIDEVYDKKSVLDGINPPDK